MLEGKFLNEFLTKAEIIAAKYPEDIAQVANSLPKPSDALSFAKAPSMFDFLISSSQGQNSLFPLLKNNLINMSLAGTLALGGYAGISKGIMEHDIHQLASKYMSNSASMLKQVPLKTAPLDARLRVAANKLNLSPELSSQFINEMNKINTEAPGLNLPSSLVGRDPATLLGKERQLYLDASNKATEQAYYEAINNHNEYPFIKRFIETGRFLDKSGNINQTFLEGISRFAPNFAKKYSINAPASHSAEDKFKSVNPDLRRLIDMATASYGDKVSLTQGSRSADYQFNLYMKDRGTTDHFKYSSNNSVRTFADGYISTSDHQHNNAVDIFLGNSNEAYSVFNKHMQNAFNSSGLASKYNLEWGGTFKNADLGHFALQPKKNNPVMIVLNAPSKMSQKEALALARASYTPSSYNLFGNSKFIQVQTIASQVLNRKILPKLGIEQKEAAVKSMLPPSNSTVKTGSISNLYVPHEDPNNNWRVYASELTNVTPGSGVTFGVRNRGDTTSIQSSRGIGITTFENFAPPSATHYKSTATGRQAITWQDNNGVIGVDSKGNLIADIYKNVKDRKDVLITKMPYQKFLGFEEKAGQQVYENNVPGFKKSVYFPKIRYLDEKSNKPVVGRANFVLNNKQADRYGENSGGRVLVRNPDTKQTYLIAGSFDEVKSAMNLVRGESKYLDMWLLDNGTYLKGLSSKSGVITKQQQIFYDNLNVGGGGNGLYIK